MTTLKYYRILTVSWIIVGTCAAFGISHLTDENAKLRADNAKLQTAVIGANETLKSSGVAMGNLQDALSRQGKALDHAVSSLQGCARDFQAAVRETAKAVGK